MTERSTMSRLSNIDPVVALLATVAVVALVARFVGLGVSPPGFYVDEAIASAQLVCLRYTGADATGESWPLISSVQIGGARAFWSPLWLYPGVGWVTVFGDSPASLRGFETLLSVVGVFATAGIARSFLGNRGWAWVLLLGSISPWGWTLGRVAFGNSAVTGVALMMTGLWLLTRGGMRRRLRWFEALGGSLLLASAVLVNHTRLAALAVLLLVVVMLFRRRLVDRTVLASGAAGLLLAALPVLVDGGRADIWARAQETWVFSDPSVPAAGLGRLTGIASVLAANVAEHLSPQFLVFSGDTNLRHSSQVAGHLGWLDLLLIAAIPMAVALVARGSVVLGVQRVYFAVVATGFVSVVLSASLTVESVPHGLRMFPAQPFVALGLGLVGIVLTERWRLVPVGAVLTAVLFAAYFAPRYFGEYPDRAGTSFDVSVVQAAAQARTADDAEGFFEAVGIGYVRSGAIYFMASGSGDQCPGDVP